MKNLKEKYDCVVVGAGPGGLMAAKTLAEAGREVFVIEKNTIIGPKICAGGLTIKDFKLGIPKKLIDKSFRKIYLHTPWQKSTIEDSKDFIAIIDRKKMGQWMKRKVEKLGVKILNDQVIDLFRNHNQIILKSGKKISYNYLIGADGSNSIIRNKLGIPKVKFITVFQYLVKKVYPKMELFLDAANFGPWYVWIFPHKNFTSIGTGSDPKIFPTEKIKQNFETWLKENNVDLSNARFEAWLINYDYRGFEFGNIFLVGDAGGFTSGLTGEGIYFAMVSGIEAAKKIIDPSYNLERLDEIIKIKKLHEKILDELKMGKLITEIEMEIINLFSKSKFFEKEIIKILL